MLGNNRNHDCKLIGLLVLNGWFHPSYKPSWNQCHRFVQDFCSLPIEGATATRYPMQCHPGGDWNPVCGVWRPEGPWVFGVSTCRGVAGEFGWGDGVIFFGWVMMRNNWAGGMICVLWLMLVHILPIWKISMKYWWICRWLIMMKDL